MTEVVRYRLDGGGTVLVEVDEPPGVQPAALPGVLRDAADSLEEALSGVRDAAARALALFRQVGPDEVEIAFGVKLDASAGALIAKTGVEGQLGVRLRWRRGTGPGPDDEGDEGGAADEGGDDPAGDQP